VTGKISTAIFQTIAYAMQKWLWYCHAIGRWMHGMDSLSCELKFTHINPKSFRCITFNMCFDSLNLTKRSSKVDIPQKSLNLWTKAIKVQDSYTMFPMSCTYWRTQKNWWRKFNTISYIAVPHNHFNHKILDYTMAYCKYMLYNFSCSYNNV